MANYKALLKAVVAKDYEAITSKTERRGILWKIAALGVDPRPAIARKLPEREDQYRICLAQHSVLYQIDERQKQVTVFRIADR